MPETKAPGYVFEDAVNGEVQSVTKVAKLEPYLVEYKDGQGQTQVRLVFSLPGTDFAWIVQKQIQGAHVVTQANEWFRKAMAKRLGAAPAKPESI